MKFHTNVIIPQELPLIALKNVVLFPRVVMPLVVQRPSSVGSLNAALEKDNLVLFVTQKNIHDEIQEKDIFRIGTVGKIVSVYNLPDKSSKVDVEGLARAEIESFIQHAPFFKVKIRPLVLNAEKNMEMEALMRNVIDKFRKITEERMMPSVLPDLIFTLNQLKDPEQVVDIITVNLNLDIQDQQDILETVDIKDALKRLNIFLTREMEIMETEKKVVKETRKQLGKMQKELFLREQLKSIEKELGLDGDRGEIGNLRAKIKNLKMPKEVEAKAMKELERLEKMPPFSPEVSYLRTYLDWLVELPWSKKTEKEVDIKQAEKILNDDHSGLEKTKERILEYIAVQKQVGKIKGPILCFVGPPGTGKTSIGQSIARSLNRKFIRVSLGGIHDEAEIRGHRRTYVGALPGRIIQSIHNAGAKDPVFMLDEIDKIGQDFRGDPSAALLEALDPEQNHSFSDHYLEVPFDLSDVIFITTANILDTIPPALRDRLEIIEFPGYTEQEKRKIAEKFLIPKLIKTHGLKDGIVDFSDGAVLDIINKHTHEAGVRDLERQISTILRKITRKIVEGGGKAKKKYKIDSDVLHQFLGPIKFTHQEAEKKDEIGVATGLAWTPVGGEVLSIEATVMPGKGKLILTGHLGTVMKESIQAALSYIRSRAKQLNINDDFYNEDIHVHVPSGATKKDGPSAGIAMACAIISLLTKKPIEKDVGMTGEITLRGKILEIGGIKEKILAAHRAGLKIIILPKANKKDMEEIPAEIKKSLKFIFVDHLDQALKVALK